MKLVPSTDGVEVALHDLGGHGPPLLVAHATGFCAGPYRPFAAAVDGYRVWALDFRAHGDTTTPGELALSWAGCTDDVLAAIDAIGEPVATFGHSMGGACLLLASLRRPDAIRRIAVFEPIVIPGDLAAFAGANPLAEAARRRREVFPSRAEALARYASRPPLSGFRADALWGYVEQGFADRPDGTVALKCTPAREAETFEAPGKPEMAEMAGVSVPVLLGYGLGEPMGPAAFGRRLVRELPLVEEQPYERLGHFAPFADPDLIAADTVAFLARP